MQFREISPEVFYATDQIVNVRSEDLCFLKKRAEQSQRKRARLCAHRDDGDSLHEMIVVLKRDVYITPEKHLKNVESYHIIDGSADVVIFDEVGNVAEVVQMGDYSSGSRFYYRLSDPLYHTLIIRSDFLMYHETRTGPFNKSDTVVATWAPGEKDVAGRETFMEGLAGKVEEFLSARAKSGERS